MHRHKIDPIVAATLLIAGLVSLALFVFGGSAQARPVGVIDHSGNPDAGEGATCTECHTGPDDLPTVTISAPSQVVGGEPVAISVTVQGGPGVIAGFNASFGDLVGELRPVDTTTRVAFSQITHTAPQPFDGAPVTFSFEWVPPIEQTSTVLYVAALSANGNGFPTGDAVGTSTAAIDVTAADVFGDVSCDGESNILDALYIAQYEVDLRVDGGSCPLAEPTMQLVLSKADINDNGQVDIIDALFIAQCDSGVVNPYCG